MIHQSRLLTIIYRILYQPAVALANSAFAMRNFNILICAVPFIILLQCVSSADVPPSSGIHNHQVKDSRGYWYTNRLTVQALNSWGDAQSVPEFTYTPTVLLRNLAVGYFPECRVFLQKPGEPEGFPLLRQRIYHLKEMSVALEGPGRSHPYFPFALHPLESNDPQQKLVSIIPQCTNKFGRPKRLMSNWIIHA